MRRRLQRGSKGPLACLLAGGAAALAVFGSPLLARASEAPRGLLVGITLQKRIPAHHILLGESSSVAWEAEMSVPGAKYLYIIFDHVRLDGEGPFSVRLVDGVGGKLAEFPGSEFAASTTFYTSEIPASEIHVQIISSRSTRPSYLSFDIDEVARDPAGISMQSTPQSGGGYVPVRTLPRAGPILSLSRRSYSFPFPMSTQRGGESSTPAPALSSGMDWRSRTSTVWHEGRIAPL